MHHFNEIGDILKHKFIVALSLTVISMFWGRCSVVLTMLAAKIMF